MIRWRNSAALRLSLAYSACMALGVIVLWGAVFWTMHQAFQQQIDADLADESLRLAQEYRGDAGARAELGELRDAIAARETIHAGSEAGSELLYGLYDAAGHRIAGSLPLRRPALGKRSVEIVDPVEGPDKLRVLASDPGGGLRLVVAADSERMERIDTTMATAFALALLGVLVLGAGGAFVFARLLRDRLGRLAERATAISEGSVSERMPVSGRDDEFDALASSLNHMLARIETLIGNLRQVSGAVAHDLRTPLARLRQRVEMAAQATSEPHVRDQLARADEAIEEVLALFAGILHLSEVESGTALPMAPVDLTALAVEIGEGYEPPVREGGRQLTWHTAPGIIVTGSRSLLAQALSNLLENAMRYTPPGTRIAIALDRVGAEARLAVRDDGPGIAAGDRARVLRRFERLDSARGRPGFGLGLPLVEAVVRRHGGRLELGEGGPGLTATLFIPLPEAPG